MEESIKSFQGKYSFLSNFHHSIVQFEGMNYPTVEHAYQASKSTEYFFRKLMSATPAEKAGTAKKRGRAIRLRSGWEEIKISIMHQLLREKFRNEPLRTKLLETGSAELIEGNYWHDNIWGVCFCDDKCKDIEGKNILGKLLMKVRSELNEKKDNNNG